MRDNPTWLQSVVEYRQAAERVYDSVPPPASETQMAAARKAAGAMGLHLPDEALPFYRLTNGTDAFDLHFFSLDSDDNGDFLRSQELVRADGDDRTYYGGGNDDEQYGYLPETAKFQVLYGGDLDAEFATFGEMIEFVFRKQLANITVA